MISQIQIYIKNKYVKYKIIITRLSFLSFLNVFLLKLLYKFEKISNIFVKYKLLKTNGQK